MGVLMYTKSWSNFKLGRMLLIWVVPRAKRSLLVTRVNDVCYCIVLTAVKCITGVLIAVPLCVKNVRNELALDIDALLAVS